MGLAIIGVIWLFISASSSSKNQTDNISLSADVPQEFKYEDMLAANEKKNNPYKHSSENAQEQTEEVLPDATRDDMANYFNQESADIKRIQQQILENNKEQDSLKKKRVQLDRLPVPKEKPMVVSEVKDSISPVKIDTIPPAPLAEIKKKKSRFFSVSAQSTNGGNTIRAVVHGDQEVTDGATLKMRVLEDCVADDGSRIPKNTEVSGIVSLSGERVQVKIQSIRIGSTLSPFNKQVFGSDAIAGIYIPGNIKSEVAKEAAGDGIDGVSSSNVIRGTGIIGDVVGGVLDAGKNVLSRNVRINKVLIKTNYEIYLR